jgi:hypothetical protein
MCERGQILRQYEVALGINPNMKVTTSNSQTLGQLQSKSNADSGVHRRGKTPPTIVSKAGCVKRMTVTENDKSGLLS